MSKRLALSVTVVTVVGGIYFVFAALSQQVGHRSDNPHAGVLGTDTQRVQGSGERGSSDKGSGDITVPVSTPAAAQRTGTAPRPDSKPRAVSRSVALPIPAGTITRRTTAAAKPSPTPAPAPPPGSPKRTSRPAPQLVAPPPVAPPPVAPKPVASKPVAPRSVAPPNFGVPVTVGNATQMVTVAASSLSATSGTLTAWQKQSDGSWRKMFGPVTAHLGSDGIGTPSEDSSRTPRGTWGLTQGFGRSADPGTSMPYSQVGTRDWWVSDVDSPKYNTHQICSADSCGFSMSASENLYNAGPVYDYAMVMDVNRSPSTPGGGSAFFLHVTDGGPTAGCVSVDAPTLVSILRWLQPGAHPRIAVGVGRPISGPRV